MAFPPGSVSVFSLFAQIWICLRLWSYFDERKRGPKCNVMCIKGAEGINWAVEHKRQVKCRCRWTGPTHPVPIRAWCILLSGPGLVCTSRGLVYAAPYSMSRMWICPPVTTMLEITHPNPMHHAESFCFRSLFSFLPSVSRYHSYWRRQHRHCRHCDWRRSSRIKT